MELLECKELHEKVEVALRSCFRSIQEEFASMFSKYQGVISGEAVRTPAKIGKGLKKSPSLNFSTPKRDSKRKLVITPKRIFSSGKKSKKNSDVDPDKLFGQPIKVNLHDIFQGYVSSSDDCIDKPNKL